MDQKALSARLQKAKLVIGLVGDTVGKFITEQNPAPVGAISFDLDYYSSTIDSFGILGIDPAYRLPRIFTYFDDVMSSDLGHVGHGVGVPLAIDEFNAMSTERQLIRLTHLEHAGGPSRLWHRMIYSYCDFTHPGYNRYIIGTDRQLALP